MIKDFFIPTEKNNYRAHFAKAPTIIALTLVLLTFNIFTKNTSAASIDSDITIQTLLQQHNLQRARENLKPLELNSLLIESSEQKAIEMLESNCWSHYCPNGRSPWEFFKDSGYEYIFAGENLAEGFESIDELMNAWLNSKTHRENILKPEFDEVGFGIAYGDYQGLSDNILIVVHFGARGLLVSENTSVSSINILSPSNEENITDSYINVNGEYSNLDKVNIFNNNRLEGEASISEGVFTFKIINTYEGLNVIEAEGYLDNVKTAEDSVSINYLVPTDAKNGIFIPSNSVFDFTSEELSQKINLGFALFFVIIFFVDALMLARSKILREKRSYSHYHFGIMSISIIMLLIGGFSSQIGVGIFN